MVDWIHIFTIPSCKDLIEMTIIYAKKRENKFIAAPRRSDINRFEWFLENRKQVELCRWKRRGWENRLWSRTCGGEGSRGRRSHSSQLSSREAPNPELSGKGVEIRWSIKGQSLQQLQQQPPPPTCLHVHVCKVTGSSSICPRLKSKKCSLKTLNNTPGKGRVPRVHGIPQN